jgi:carboxyl-terminal processing protease
VAQKDEDAVEIGPMRLSDAVKLIKGPKGTQVFLTVRRVSGIIEEVEINRDIVELEESYAKSSIIKKNGKNYGLIQLPKFYIDFKDQKSRNAASDVKKELEALKAENVEGIIIDLRGNGGGSLSEATLLTGLFIDKGPVVQVRDGANRISVNRDKDGITYYDGPLTVMVDRYSASASEIFSAAIQDYGRGIIIGEHTFGKGTVQQHRPLGRVYDLYDKPFGSIQYTIAKFYRTSHIHDLKDDVVEPYPYQRYAHQ